MKSKKLIALLLASAMSVSVLAACGGKTETPATETKATESTTTETATDAGQAEDVPENGVVASNGVVFSPDNPRTITAWIVTNETMPAEDNKITQLLKDKLGVTIEYELTITDNQDMRIGTMLAGGEYPDLIGSTDQRAGMVTGGALLKLDDYLASGDYPLLAEHVDPYMGYLSYKGGEVDDGLYIFPNYNRWYGEITGGEHWGPGFWIQKAVLEDAGYPDLDNITIERYFELIENYAAKYPEINGVPTVGFAIGCATGREWALTNPPALLAGSPNNGGVIVDDNDVANIYANSDYAYRWFKCLNEADKKGLVDRESFTTTNDQYYAKIASGAVLGMHDQRWAFGQGQDALVAAKMYERTYVAVMPTFDGATPWYADRPVMNVQQGFGVSSTCKEPEVALAFLEIMMSEEWQKILFWGIEGEDYLVGDDGLFYRTDEMRREQEDLIWRASNTLRAFRDQLPKRQGTYPDGNPHDAAGSKIEFYETLVDYDKQFLEAYNKQTWLEFINQAPDNPLYYPCWNIELTDDANVADKQMQQLSMQYLPKAIMASTDEFDDVWADYCSQFDKVDVKTYLDCINTGIQDRIAMYQ